MGVRRATASPKSMLDAPSGYRWRREPRDPAGLSGPSSREKGALRPRQRSARDNAPPETTLRRETSAQPLCGTPTAWGVWGASSLWRSPADLRRNDRTMIMVEVKRGRVSVLVLSEPFSWDFGMARFCGLGQTRTTTKRTATGNQGNNKAAPSCWRAI